MILGSVFGISVGVTLIFQLLARSRRELWKIFFAQLATVPLFPLSIILGSSVFPSLDPDGVGGFAAAFLFVTLVAALIANTIFGAVRAVFLNSERTE